jgi:hypothetical protein
VARSALTSRLSGAFSRLKEEPGVVDEAPFEAGGKHFPPVDRIAPRRA